jgi:hypothetical protein
VRVNNAFVASYFITDNEWRAVQEVIPTNTIQQGNNTVEFRVIRGSSLGRLSIGDVTLWYRKNV